MLLHWFIRSNIIIRSIEGQFITHSIEPGIEFIIENDHLSIIQSHSFCNNIGSIGTTSLSETLKVNSSLTHLVLWIEFIIDYHDSLFLNHIPFLTILEIQEQHHYQKHWRLIHLSLNWTWEWVYYWTWLIDYYWISFHFITILEIQEHHHYQMHWRSIHHSLNWTWEWVYYWTWLIDYYWMTFHL